MFAVQGGIYLLLKTEGALHARIARAVPRLMVVFLVLNTLVVIALLLFDQQITERYMDDIWPVIFPTLALRGADRVVPDGPARGAVPGVPAVVGDDRPAAHLGRDRALSEPHHLDDSTRPTA